MPYNVTFGLDRPSCGVNVPPRSSSKVPVFSAIGFSDNTTKDLDVGIGGTRTDRLQTLSRSLNLGFDKFTISSTPLGQPDYHEAAQSGRNIFAARATHDFPPDTRGPE